MAGMDRGRNTELFHDFKVAAPGTTSNIAQAPNQSFEDMVAGLATVLIDWHNEKSPHAGCSVRVGQQLEDLPGVSQNAMVGFALPNPCLLVFWSPLETLSMLAGSG